MSSVTASTLTVGTVILNDRAFTSPVGAHFIAGESFVVDLVSVSTRCRHDRTGAVVWIQGSRVGSRFLVANGPLPYPIALNAT